MSDSGPERKPLTDQLDTSDTDDIEILEVIGLDEDAASAAGELPAEDDDPEEIVLDLGEIGDAAPRVEEAAPEGEPLRRLQADFENYKKRVERDQENREQQAAARLVGRLLPVLDNFERAVAAGYEGVEYDRSFHDGIALIFRQLLDELRREGLRPVDTVGQPFDPHLHEAVATASDSGLPSHTIVEELQRGYQLHDRLLRPALVRVAVDGDEGGAPTDAGEER